MLKPSTILAMTTLCLTAAAAVEAGPPVYRVNFQGHPWIEWRYPDGDSVGQDCFSNCGAGCNDSPNPCGGRQQYWVQEMLEEPWFSGVNYRTTCDSFTGTLYVYSGQVYNAHMQETYEGFSTAGCQLHDNTCFGGWWWPGCWWAPLSTCLIDREDKSWSWVAVRDGRLWELAEIIEGGCPCVGDQICPPY